MCGLLQLCSVHPVLFGVRGKKKISDQNSRHGKGHLQHKSHSMEDNVFLPWMDKPSNNHKKELHFFPQATGRLLTNSQQPHRNKFEAQPAARTM